MSWLREFFDINLGYNYPQDKYTLMTLSALRYADAITRAAPPHDISSLTATTIPEVTGVEALEVVSDNITEAAFTFVLTGENEAGILVNQEFTYAGGTTPLSVGNWRNVYRIRIVSNYQNVGNIVVQGIAIYLKILNSPSVFLPLESKSSYFRVPLNAKEAYVLKVNMVISNQAGGATHQEGDMNLMISRKHNGASPYYSYSAFHIHTMEIYEPSIPIRLLPGDGIKITSPYNETNGVIFSTMTEILILS